jgi:hypothetical protein
VVKTTYIISFGRGIWLFQVCLTVKENVEMPENYGLCYEYQEKKDGNLQAEMCSLRNLYIIYWISLNIFCLCISTQDKKKEIIFEIYLLDFI